MKIGRNGPCPCGSGKKYKSCCYNFQIDIEKMQSIFQSLLGISKTLKTSIPQVLLDENVKWIHFLTPKYLIFSILSQREFDRVNSLMEKNINPFPGLINTEATKAAFRFDKALQCTLKGCTVSNMISISLGQDSTISIIDHSQELNTIELGQYKYIIELTYLVSFGDIINKANIYDYIIELVNHSVEEWRELS